MVVRISGLAGDDGIQVSRGSELPSASRAASYTITDCLLNVKLMTDTRYKKHNMDIEYNLMFTSRNPRLSIKILRAVENKPTRPNTYHDPPMISVL